MKHSPYLLVNEVASSLGLSTQGVRWLIDTGRLRGVRTPSGVRLVSAAEVERVRLEREKNPVYSPARKEAAMATRS